MLNVGFTHQNAALYQWGVVLVASLVAALWDLKSRRIPNVLTGPLFAVGLVQAAMFSGWDGIGSAFLASVILAMPYVILFMFAGGGAGDAKLMAGIGAWLGLQEVLAVLFFVSLFGIAMALLKAAFKGRFFAVLKNIQAMVISFILLAVPQGPRQAAKEALYINADESERLTIPYGPAIFAGVVCAAIFSFIF